MLLYYSINEAKKQDFVGDGLDNAYYYMVAIGLEQPQLYSQVTDVLLEMRKAFGSS